MCSVLLTGLKMRLTQPIAQRQPPILSERDSQRFARHCMHVRMRNPLGNYHASPDERLVRHAQRQFGCIRQLVLQRLWWFLLLCVLSFDCA